MVTVSRHNSVPWSKDEGFMAIMELNDSQQNIHIFKEAENKT